MSTDEVKQTIQKHPVAAGSLAGTILLFAGALGINVAFPGARLDAVETNQAATEARVDTLAARFDTHVRAAARQDTVLMQMFVPVYIGECLDRPTRETDIMRLGCDSLVSRRTTRGAK